MVRAPGSLVKAGGSDPPLPLKVILQDADPFSRKAPKGVVSARCLPGTGTGPWKGHQVMAGRNQSTSPRGPCGAVAGVRTPLGGVVLWCLVALGLASPGMLNAQAEQGAIQASDSVEAMDSPAPPPGGGEALPVFVVLGLGYGNRSDDCILCASPEDNKSFTGHLGVGRPLGHGFGVGLDVSVWRRGRPGTPLLADSSGVPVETSLANTLGNLSVSVSYDFWHLYARAGAGVAFGAQDLETLDANGDLLVHTASGWGVGYSAGLGLTIPVASVVSLSIFANWNVGHYDMISPQGLTERQAKHEYVEVGAGLAVR